MAPLETPNSPLLLKVVVKWTEKTPLLLLSYKLKFRSAF